jgi:hypothetical protein
MVDRKELKIHKIDNMSREQLEVRLQELVRENQIVIEGEVEVVPEDMAEDMVEDVLEEDADLEETNLLEVSDSSEQ